MRPISLDKVEGFRFNSIYCGNCQEVLPRKCPDDYIDLIYVDPPFFSNKKYEVIWGDGYELRCFEDRWKGGINNYIAWMEPKIRECHRVLKKTGSMYLHCDWHANAHLRILMDGIFGPENFQNEIVWHYRSGGGTSKRFSRKHDTIYLYSKSEECRFYPDDIREPYAPSTIARLKYKGAREKNVDKVLRRGGRVPDDVWAIEHVQGNSEEACGYPTQKPEALLERIIKASSKPADAVLDPMCGCGTALIVAHRLGRQWVGIDVSPTAVNVMKRRMQRLGVFSTKKEEIEHISGLPRSMEEVNAMEPFEFQNWVCRKAWARPSRMRVGDKGIDGWRTNGTPLQVKQSENVGRNVVDNFETAMRRAGKKKGIIVAFSFSKGAHEEAARAELDEGLEIELKTVKKLMDEA